MHSLGELFLCFGDINGHVGRHSNRFVCVSGRFGFGFQIKFCRKIVLEFWVKKDVLEICFAREEIKKVTFSMV